MESQLFVKWLFKFMHTFIHNIFILQITVFKMASLRGRKSQRPPDVSDNRPPDEPHPNDPGMYVNQFFIVCKKYILKDCINRALLYCSLPPPPPSPYMYALHKHPFLTNH